MVVTHYICSCLSDFCPCCSHPMAPLYRGPFLVATGIIWIPFQQQAGLRQSLEELKNDLPWIERLDIMVDPLPAPKPMLEQLGSKPDELTGEDVHDDFKREMKLWVCGKLILLNVNCMKYGRALLSYHLMRGAFSLHKRPAIQSCIMSKTSCKSVSWPEVLSLCLAVIAKHKLQY